MSTETTTGAAAGGGHFDVREHHVAVRVSNLEKCGQFFLDALDARWLSDPLPLDQSTCHNLFDGPVGGTARFAFVGFGELGQPALELIEFDDPHIPFDPTNNWEERLMHMCFTVEDVDGALARIEAAGGKRFRDIKRIGENQELSQVYFRDLDGNLFQMLSLPMHEVAEMLNAISDGVATA
ncbi:MAG: VOC family protein [Actinomycetota bacterium]|nr:VOC family protein [Actinomycetota bacterium]